MSAVKLTDVQRRILKVFDMTAYRARVVGLFYTGIEWQQNRMRLVALGLLRSWPSSIGAFHLTDAGRLAARTPDAGREAYAVTNVMTSPR